MKRGSKHGPWGHLLTLGLVLGCAACASSVEESPTLDPADDSFLLGKSDHFVPLEGSPEALAILLIANQSPYHELVSAPPYGPWLHPTAAGYLVQYRQAYGPFGTLAALDAVPYIGAAAMQALLEFAASLGLVCQGPGCPTAIDPRAEQAALLEQLAAKLLATTGTPDLTGDVERALAEGHAIIEGGAGSDIAYVTAAWWVFREFRQGHLSFQTPLCESGEVLTSYFNPWGACVRRASDGRGSNDGFVVTFAAEGNSLGLAPGDTIVSVDGRSGAELDQALLDRPVCGGGMASSTARELHLSYVLLATLREGSSVRVRSAGGSTRDVVAGAGDQWVSCVDPMGRQDSGNDPYVDHWEGGTAVVRLPSFTPPSAGPPPTDATEVGPYMERVMEVYGRVFDEVRDAERIVWDARGNVGGFSLAALEIAGGFPGVRTTQISMCDARIEGTEPPAYVLGHEGYTVASSPTFEFDGPVAVLVDGGSGSAGDYFALATTRATDAILVGEPSAGAYGSSSGSATFGAVTVGLDVLRCMEPDGTLLEGSGVTPDLAVTYDAEALAEGRDPILDAALDALGR